MSNKKENLTAVRPLSVLGGILILVLLLSACGGNEQPPAQQQPLPTQAPAVDAETAPAAVNEPTATLLPSPTPTPALAALVNQQPITLEVYERELVRYEQTQADLNVSLEGNYQNRVLLALVEQMIIEQAAVANNISVTPDLVQSRMSELIQEVGGQENFEAWLAISKLNQDEFVERLTTEMITEQVVNLITADVPYAVEQVRARHIELTDPVLAQSLVDQARGGADFAALAQTYSQDANSVPVGGDLGFFARGWLTVPQIEEAAFALQVGETSDVIQVERNGQTVYHVVQVIERDPARPLEGNQRAQLLQETFEQWLTNQLSTAEIVRFVE